MNEPITQGVQVFTDANAIIYQNNAYVPAALTGTIEIPLPETPNPSSLYVVSMKNNADAEATVTFYNVENFGSDVDIKLADCKVSANATLSQPVRGWFVGKSAKLGLTSASNLNLSICIRKA